MKGLIIKSPWIEKILNGEKTWEIRGTKTSIRGRVALIKSGTGMIYGYIDVIGSTLLEPEIFQGAQDKHCIPLDVCKLVKYKKINAWAMTNPEILNKPIPYKHPQGAVIWVNI